MMGVMYVILMCVQWLYEVYGSMPVYLVSYYPSISCSSNISWFLSFLWMFPFHWYLFSLDLWSLFSSLFLRLLSSSVSNVECSCVGLVLTDPLFMLLLLLLVTSCFSSRVKMLCNGSVLICLCSWSQRFCSAEICVTSWAVFVMWMWYHLPWWCQLPFHSIVPWVYGSPFSHWTATVDPIGIETNFGGTFAFVIFCFFHDNWEFTIIVCNAKIMLIIESEHVCTSYIPWSPLIGSHEM